ncbi:MAG: hypothetical protein LAN62_07030 [Acidobacteriia bacterium]|nr:hypothetical protein [Terriglobia bacterium]
MNSNHFKASSHRLVNLLALTLLLPLGAAASTKTCDPGTPTRDSHTWDFPSETTNLIEQMRSHAARVSRNAETLQSFGRSRQVSWQTHAAELTQVREGVNAMGTLLCRLQAIRHVALPWQQRTIDQILPRLAPLASRTEAAIEVLDDNRNSLFATDYAEHVNDIYGYASSISESVGALLEYAKLQDRLEQSKEELEGKLQQLNVVPPDKEG